MSLPENPEPVTRIAVLESQLDDLATAFARIETKLDAIQAKQAEFDVHAKLVASAGKLILGFSAAVFGLFNWDRAIQVLHELTSPPPPHH